ncbi:MAG: septum formation initiator family protein [Bradyrhizobium sp.]|nr:septum formation initiator family protein [Bradyrhizobium sp.]
MASKQDIKNDPNDVVEIAPDVVLVARAAAEFPSLAPDSAGQPLNRQPNMGAASATAGTNFAGAAPRVDATFRASDVNDIPRLRSRGRWAKTASMAFLFALLSVVATAAWQRYGGEAQAMAAGLSSRIDLVSLLPWQKSTAAAQPEASTPPATAAADQTTAAPTASQPADTAAAASAAALPQPPSQDPAQTLQSVSRDVAGLTQQIEALKASIAELKASQEQLSHDMAKPHETKPAEAKLSETRPVEPRPTKLGAPPRPLGTIVQHKPKPPMYPPMQATAVAPLPPGAGSPPVQIAPAPPPAIASETSDDAVVMRPPMPVR